MSNELQVKLLNNVTTNIKAVKYTLKTEKMSKFTRISAYNFHIFH